jgi:hypothetical protein
MHLSRLAFQVAVHDPDSHGEVNLVMLFADSLAILIKSRVDGSD